MLENKDTSPDIMAVSMSKHQPVNIKPSINLKWTLNGVNNENWVRYRDAYDDSPTNAAIINGFSNYIYGDGLIDINGKVVYGINGRVLTDTRKTNVSKYMSKTDVKLIVKDYKTYGGYAIQVIWNSAVNPIDKKPVLIKYFPIHKLGLNVDKTTMQVNGYWYSYDWMEQGKYRPKFYPMYTGTYTEGQDIELLMVQRPSSNPFFAQPDYLSCVTDAELEGELANSRINHVKNGFQASKVINCNNGVPPTEELKKEYKDRIIRNLTGTDNTNKIIVSFNPDRDKGIEVTDIPIPELNNQYVYFAEEASRKILLGHNAPPILFPSETGGTGLGSNAQEIEMATKLAYRKSIKPMQEDIIDGLQPIFNQMDGSIALEFLDFESFDKDNVADVKMSHEKKSEVVTEKSELDLFLELGEVVDTNDWELIHEEVFNFDEYSKEVQHAGQVVGIPNAKSEQDIENFKVRYRYDGNPIGERDFCSRMVANNDRVYRYEDIMSASARGVNGEFAPAGSNDYNLFLYKGGVNCKHYWTRVIFAAKKNKDGTRDRVDVNNPNALEVSPTTVIKETGQVPVVNNPLVYQAPANMPNNGGLK